MSGVQGPLETRVKTTVETVAALQSLDATPFDSGELAYVRSISQMYELVRENLSQPNGSTILLVGPPGAVGRWLQRSFFGATGPTGATGSIGNTGATGATGPADFVTPEQFGAVGNGVADDTLAVQSALDSNGGKGVTLLLQGRYKLTSSVMPTSDTTILGLSGNAFVLAIAGGLPTDAGVLLEGANGAIETIGAASAEGDQVLWSSAVLLRANNTPVVEGDRIYAAPDVSIVSGGNRGKMYRVIDVISSGLPPGAVVGYTIDKPTSDAFAAGDRINAIDPIENVTLEGINFEGSAQRCVEAVTVWGCTFRRLTCLDGSNISDIGYSFDIGGRDNLAERCVFDARAGGANTGLAIESNESTTTRGNECYNVSGAAGFAGVTFFDSTQCTSDSDITSGCDYGLSVTSDGAFGVVPAAIRMVVLGGSHCGNRIGVSLYGDCTAYDLYVVGNTDHGIQIGDGGINDTSTINDCLCQGNGSGVHLNAATLARVRDCELVSNEHAIEFDGVTPFLFVDGGSWTIDGGQHGLIWNAPPANPTHVRMTEIQILLSGVGGDPGDYVVNPVANVSVTIDGCEIDDHSARVFVITQQDAASRVYVGRTRIDSTAAAVAAILVSDGNLVVGDGNESTTAWSAGFVDKTGGTQTTTVVAVT